VNFPAGFGRTGTTDFYPTLPEKSKGGNVEPLAPAGRAGCAGPAWYYALPKPKQGKGMEVLMVVILGAAAVIGLWTLAALLSAVAGCGGVRRLLRAWRKAVTGR
jgi:hypothetical protein